MDFKFISDGLKAVNKYTFPLLIFTSFLLFFPDSFLKDIGFYDFVRSNKVWIGMVFLLTLSFLVSSVFDLIKDKVKEHIYVRNHRKFIESYLNELTNEEKVILRRFIFKDSQSKNLNIMDGVVSGLVNKRIIYRASNIGSLFGGFAYNLQPIAYEYLKKNPHLLD